MTDIVVTPANVNYLPGAEIEEYTAGGSGSVGDFVHMADDGDCEQGDGSAAGTAHSIGCVVGVGGGTLTFAAGDKLAVVVKGRVTGFEGMTPDDVLYQSDTAGKAGDVAGTVSQKLGKARAAGIMYVDPPITEA